MIDVAPMVFATALARILSDLGYSVDVQGDPADHDLALVSGDRNGGRSSADRVEITLLQPGGQPGPARVTGRGWDKDVEVRTLDDLLFLIRTVTGPGLA